MATPEPTPISRRTIVRSVLAVLFGVLAPIAGFVFDVWPATLVLGIAAVFVAPASWIHLDGDDMWDSAGPTGF